MMGARLSDEMNGFMRTRMTHTKHATTPAEYPISSKQRLAERWAQRRLGRIDHERRVAAIASILFELSRSRHQLGAAEKRILLLGAALHDVGRRVDDKRHPTVGARMILASSSLPFTGSERRSVAYLTRYHRGAVPEVGYDDVLSPSDGRKRMRLVLALLRAADALDGRQVEAPRLVFALTGRRLLITCYFDESAAKTRRILKRRKKFRLLQDLLDLKIDLETHQVDAMQAVA
jgi:exopolyphosphatase/guanosine-5'-triphosphate,3'-diphosphate pyrophosphatase